MKDRRKRLSPATETGSRRLLQNVVSRCFQTSLFRRILQVDTSLC